MSSRTRFRTSLAACLAGAAILVLPACSGSSSSPSAPPTGDAGPTETASFDDIRALLPEEIAEAGTLINGSPMTSPPLIYTEGGQPTGIVYDISQEMGEILGVDIEWQDLAFPGVIPGLQGGSLDISMGIIGDTAERQEVLDFVDLFKNESSLLTQKGNPSDVTDLENACGLTLGTLTGSLQLARLKAASEACTADGEPAITINEYSSQADGQAAVQSERIAAFYAPYVSLNHVALTAGDGEIFEMGTGRYPENPFGIAMAKDRGTLAEALQAALLELVENGRYQEILESYGSEAAALTPDQVLINGAGTDAFPLD